MSFGNVNVDYKPCKSVGQLKSATLYMLGRKPEQLREGIIKTAPDLYTALGCERDNFANNVLVTRKLNGKSYSRLKPNTILAHKMSISFHPDDNDRLNYQTAFEIAKEFAERFIHSKGYEVLLAVHTDREHIHVHFLISNCNTETGKSYRRSQRDLYEMSEYFGQRCLEHGLTNSVREEYYNHSLNREKETFAETQMKKRGAETFKDELREVIQIEIADRNNRCFDDVIKALSAHYNIECRVAGNTVSYRHPEYKDKNGKLVSVRGSKLGDLYTRKGIENAITEKQSIAAEFGRQSDAYSAEHELIRATAGLGEFVGEDSNAQGGRQTIGGGQVSGVAAPCNDGKALQDFDRLYDRYRKRASENEQRANEAAERARAVQKRNKGRDR
ncbi:MAG: relaxase/mobilization nuclease domain-containing protein [Oscillospiraceae bacterium]|jgi:hypothetical protein